MTIAPAATAATEAADRLYQAYQDHAVCAPVRDLLAETDSAAAYAVQEINTRRWLEQGRRLVGRKIGLTSLAIQKQLADAEQVPIGRLLQPRIEGEIALCLGRDLPHADVTLSELVGAVDYALAALEIVDSRVQGWDIRLADTIADNASSGCFVIGSQPRRLSDFDPRLCGMVLERKGEPVSVGAGAACLGNPLTATLWLARKMAEVGRPLRAGDLVLSGALGPMVPVTAGDRFELRINGLGSVRVGFSDV
jgi:2-keto-4-pentenoate hydratase